MTQKTVHSHYKELVEKAKPDLRNGFITNTTFNPERFLSIIRRSEHGEVQSVVTGIKYGIAFVADTLEDEKVHVWLTHIGEYIDIDQIKLTFERVTEGECEGRIRVVPGWK